MYIEQLLEREQLPPGTRIITRGELQERLGVARSTVGEAIKILQDRGRVTVRPGPGGGLFVADPQANVRLRQIFFTDRDSAVEVEQAGSLRDQIEPMVLREAIAHHTSKDIDDLFGILNEAIAQMADPPEVLRQIWRIHARIGRISPNLFLRTTYIGLIDYLATHLRGETQAPFERHLTFTATRIQAHRRLIELVAFGDPSEIDAVIALHDDYAAAIPDAAGADGEAS